MLGVSSIAGGCHAQVWPAQGRTMLEQDVGRALALRNWMEQGRNKVKTSPCKSLE